MAKRQRLTLQVFDEISINPLREDNEENHLEKDYGDSSKFLPELDEEVPNEVTDSDTHNEPVCSTSNQSFRFPQTGRAGLSGECGHIPGSFALLFCHFLYTKLNSEKEHSFLDFLQKVHLNPCINAENINLLLNQPFQVRTSFLDFLQKVHLHPCINAENINLLLNQPLQVRST